MDVIGMPDHATLQAAARAFSAAIKTGAQIGLAVDGLRLGPVRLVPEAAGCRVGLDREPMSNMQWHASLEDALQSAVRARESLRRRGMRVTGSDEGAGARARRIVSRLVSDGLEAALAAEIEQALQQERDLSESLRHLIRQQGRSAFDVRLRPCADGYAVTVVAADDETADHLAQRVAMNLAPLVALLRRTLRTLPVDAGEDEIGAQPVDLPQVPFALADATHREIAVDQIVAGDTRVVFADVVLVVARRDAHTDLELHTIDSGASLGAAHYDPEGGATVSATDASLTAVLAAIMTELVQRGDALPRPVPAAPAPSAVSLPEEAEAELESDSGHFYGDASIDGDNGNEEQDHDGDASRPF